MESDQRIFQLCKTSQSMVDCSHCDPASYPDDSDRGWLFGGSFHLSAILIQQNRYIENDKQITTRR